MDKFATLTLQTLEFQHINVIPAKCNTGPALHGKHVKEKQNISVILVILPWIPGLIIGPAYRTPEKARSPRLFATPVGDPSAFCLTESYIQRTSKTAFSFARAMNHHFRCFSPLLLVTSCIQRSTREASGHVVPQSLRPRFKASFYQETCLELLFEVLRGKLDR